ncbi:hypothetical protein BDV23DRAFT_180781 [Aspergillus alliaceus]|uniref:Uncharacterized protein n=1 Tax=Petromyces alliaceus TaxID=209559 RepID=A0A5N7CH19_PETAA|nr:hypothetical protein BDV23DRAFT_180781 [Aspergillus alliaceus]
MSRLHLNLNDDDPWIIEQKIFDLLNDYLQPCNAKSALTTAQELDNLFPTNRSIEGQPKNEHREEPESFGTCPTLLEEINRTGFTGTEGRQNWHNLSTLLARMTRDRTANFFGIAIQEIGEDLEGHVLFRHEHAYPGDLEIGFLPGVEEDIATAAEWTALRGDVLFSRDEEVPGSRSGPLWEGKSGLCPGRWCL